MARYVYVLAESEGDTIPTAVQVKEDAADKPFKFEGITGKNIFVRLADSYKFHT